MELLYARIVLGNCGLEVPGHSFYREVNCILNPIHNLTIYPIVIFNRSTKLGVVSFTLVAVHVYRILFRETAGPMVI